MKKLLGFILGVFLLISCSTNRPITSDDTYGYSRMRFTMNTTLCQYQVDSMISVDKLAPLDKWHKACFKVIDVPTTQYLYIKSAAKNKELIYTVTQANQDTIYKCTKRITEDVR